MSEERSPALLGPCLQPSPNRMRFMHPETDRPLPEMPPLRSLFPHPAILLAMAGSLRTCMHPRSKISRRVSPCGHRRDLTLRRTHSTVVSGPLPAHQKHMGQLIMADIHSHFHPFILPSFLHRQDQDRLFNPSYYSSSCSSSLPQVPLDADWDHSVPLPYRTTA